MDAKKRANQSASPKKTRIDDASSAQRVRLLARIKQGPVDAFTAIRELNILRPGARISELRDAGHPINTRLATMTDDQGRTHHGIALYYIGALPVAAVEVSE